mgnify:CR=1 FL=1
MDERAVANEVRAELAARGVAIEDGGGDQAEIAREISADLLIYQDLDALIDDVRSLNPAIEKFDCSCFDGVYVTGHVSQEYLDRVAAGRHLRESAEAGRLSSYQLDLGLQRAID